MNLYEFNTLILAMQMEIYDLEKELATLQLGKDDNEEKKLKIKEIQKKLNEKNNEMQKVEELQLKIQRVLIAFPNSFSPYRNFFSPYRSSSRVGIKPFYTFELRGKTYKLYPYGQVFNPFYGQAFNSFSPREKFENKNCYRYVG